MSVCYCNRWPDCILRGRRDARRDGLLVSLKTAGALFDRESVGHSACQVGGKFRVYTFLDQRPPHCFGLTTATYRQECPCNGAGCNSLRLNTFVSHCLFCCGLDAHSPAHSCSFRNTGNASVFDTVKDLANAYTLGNFYRCLFKCSRYTVFTITLHRSLYSRIHRAGYKFRNSCRCCSDSLVYLSGKAS